MQRVLNFQRSKKDDEPKMKRTHLQSQVWRISQGHIGFRVYQVAISHLIAFLLNCRKLLFSDFKYAAFIVFSFLDAEFMEKVLHFLETELQLKCCVHFRDFAPGKPFVENMAYSVNNSYKVVVLFSNNFLTSEFAEYEMKLAIHRMVERRDNSLVVIRIDDVDPSRLPSELITKSFIDYNSYLERPFWKQRILEFFIDEIPCDNKTMNNNSICYEHTDRSPYKTLQSTLVTQSQMSYV